MEITVTFSVGDVSGVEISSSVTLPLNDVSAPGGMEMRM